MLWIVLLVAPVAAKYMIPLQSESYTVLSINNAYLKLSSSVIGLQLGVISALLLSPLAYIYLRTSRINQTPWQIEDVTPTKRFALHLGQWGADTCIVWLVLVILALSGVVLSFFRLPFSEISVGETIFCCLVISCPAFACIAVMRLLFASRPLLRGATGDVLFFFIWVFGISAGVHVANSGGSGFWDLFGFVHPILLSADEPVEMLVVGAVSASYEKSITVDALAGVTQIEFILSRITWLGIAVAAVLFSSFVYKTKVASARQNRNFLEGIRRIVGKVNWINQFIFPAMLPAQVRSNIMLTLRPEGLIAVLLVIGLAGLILPYNTVIGPALWLITLFPFSHHAGQWSQQNLQSFLRTLPLSTQAILVCNLVAFSVIMLVLSAPSILRIVLIGDYTVLHDVVLIAFIVPTSIILLSYTFKSSFAVRLPMLIAWYVYFSAA